MESRSTKIVDGGKLVIPASFRRELGLQIGDTVVMEVVEGELRVRSRDAAIAEISEARSELCSRKGQCGR